MLTSSKLQTSLLKQPFKTQKKLKKLEIMHKIQSILVFLDITKVADFWLKNVDASRTQGLCHMIYMFLGSSLGKL